jgi:Sec-independent protein translocase protein TatA
VVGGIDRQKHMEILGVGGWELAAVVILALIVAGPKRMLAWSYVLGTYVSKLRKIWADTASVLQKEFDQAGVDVQVPTEPSRDAFTREINRAVQKAGAPVSNPMKEIQQELNDTAADVKKLNPTRPLLRSETAKKPAPPPASTEPTTPPPAEAPAKDDPPTFGTWSG